jgi:hypothetical protein
MRRSGLLAVSAALILAFAIPARAESTPRRDADHGAKAKAVRQKDCAGKDQAKAEGARKAAPPSDTIVVPAGPDHPGYTMVGENVTYDDPTFVPYKLREAARRARATTDISKIP